MTVRTNHNVSSTQDMANSVESMIVVGVLDWRHGPDGQCRGKRKRWHRSLISRKAVVEEHKAERCQKWSVCSDVESVVKALSSSGQYPPGFYVRLGWTWSMFKVLMWSTWG